MLFQSFKLFEAFNSCEAASELAWHSSIRELSIWCIQVMRCNMKKQSTWKLNAFSIFPSWLLCSSSCAHNTKRLCEIVMEYFPLSSFSLKIDWFSDSWDDSTTHFKILLVSQATFSLIQYSPQLSSDVGLEDTWSVESWSTSPTKTLKFRCEILLLFHPSTVVVGCICSKFPFCRGDTL